MDREPLRTREVVVRRMVLSRLYVGILAAVVRAGWMEAPLAVFVFCLAMVRGRLVAAGPVVALTFAGVVGWCAEGRLLRRCQRKGPHG